MLTGTLIDAVHTALRAAGDDAPIRVTRPVGGGCINNAHYIATAARPYLLKWNAHAAPGMFLVEARGLALIRAAGSVRAPEVLCAADARADAPAFILMEWLEPPERMQQADQATLGAQLAALHRAAPAPGMTAAYGLDHDNYIGSTPQLNSWDDDWPRFFRERRLRPQIALAQRNGLVPLARRQALERVLERLDTWLDGVERRPALIHGDLWGGNVIPCATGELALIDPAVYYADREAELAYTELFGGFSPRFYAAYREAWPLDPGYADRRDLYNLYHLFIQQTRADSTARPHLPRSSPPQRLAFLNNAGQPELSRLARVIVSHFRILLQQLQQLPAASHSGAVERVLLCLQQSYSGVQQFTGLPWRVLLSDAKNQRSARLQQLPCRVTVVARGAA